MRGGNVVFIISLLWDKYFFLEYLNAYFFLLKLSYQNRIFYTIIDFWLIPFYCRNQNCTKFSLQRFFDKSYLNTFEYRNKKKYLSIHDLKFFWEYIIGFNFYTQFFYSMNSRNYIANHFYILHICHLFLTLPRYKVESWKCLCDIPYIISNIYIAH